MGRISLAAFKPKPGKEDDLLKVVDDRVPLLRKLGMVTDRAPIGMRSSDGVILQVSESHDDFATFEAIDT